MQQEKLIIKIEKKEIESQGSIGKYLNRHVVPGTLYVVEQFPELIVSCICNINKPLLVFSSKASGAQLLMEAAGGEMAFSEKLSKLEKKALWIDESDKLMAINLWTRCEMLKREHDIQVVLMDDYRFLVDDYFQKIPDELRLTMLQHLSEKLGITVITQKCPPEESEAQVSQSLVFHNNWWNDKQQETRTNSIFDYWES